MMRCLFLLSLLVAFIPVKSQDHAAKSKSDRLYERGIELIHHREYGAARQVFSEFLEQAPGSDVRRPEASYYQAFASVSLGHSDGEKLIEGFIRDYPADPRSATAYLELANYFYNEGTYSRAVTYYRKVNINVLNPTQQREARFRWGYSYFNLRRFNEALEQFNYIKTQSTPYTPAASYYSGFIYYADGKFSEALDDLKRAELYPAYANVVPHLIVLCHYKLGEYDELIAYAGSLEAKAANINNYNDILALKGDAYYFKGDYANASLAYSQALGGEKTRTADSRILLRAGFASFQTSKDNEAIEYLKAAAGNDSIGFYASYYLGLIYLKQGNKAFAFNVFEAARKCRDCGNIAEESTFQLGKVSYDLGRTEYAIDVLEQFRSTYPNSERANEVKELLAQAYVNGSNYNKAIEYIETLPRRSPAVDIAYQKATYLKGAELFNSNDFPTAIQFFEKSLKYPIDKKYHALASLWCAEAYSVSNNFDAATPHYLTVIGLGTAVEQDVLLRARYGLGYAYFNLEQYDRALVSFREFVSKSANSNPNFIDATIRLADCYYVSKSYDNALTYYNRARQFNTPDNDYVFLQMGMIYGINRKYAESREQLSLLINSYPKSPYRDEAMFQLAQFEIEQGNYQVAVDGLSRLIGEMRNSKFLPYAFIRRAASNYNLKEYDKTINDYVFVLRNFPSHPEAQKALIPLQEVLTLTGRVGEWDGILAAFKQANPGQQDFEVVEFLSAKNMYFNLQYDRAVSGFRSFLESYPSSSRVDSATYFLAESYYRQNDFDKALETHIALSSRTNFPALSRVYTRIAEIQFRQGKYTDAIASYHQLEQLADSKRDLYNAWSGLMESFYLNGAYDSTDVYARRILEKGNVNTTAINRATLFLGKAAMARGDYDGAKDEFLTAINNARDESGAEAKYRIAEIQFLTGQHNQSIETLFDMSNTAEYRVYQEWYGRAFLLLADNFFAVDNSLQATRTLESLAEFPLASIRELAKAKLDEYRKSEQQAVPEAQDSLRTGN